MQQKPFSQACENNKKPILNLLQVFLKKPQTLLEIGSGTGQHSVYFAKYLPHVQWQTSDRLENHRGIQDWHESVSLKNLQLPILLDVACEDDWPETQFDSVFSANTAHIMSWSEVVMMFNVVATVLRTGGIFMQYGPFNKQGKYTSASNQRFDQWLKSQGDHMGLRDLASLKSLAKRVGLEFTEAIEMPANNFMLLWHKINLDK